jgi:Ca2+-binding RTX toxin-like protein
MRLVGALVCTLGIAAAAPAGVITPPTVDANAPVWLDAHTVGFEYAANAYSDEWYQARDDGSGFAPAPQPPPDRTFSPDGKHQYSVDPLTGALSVDGRVVAKGPVYIGRVAWSPDSEWLAYVNGDDTTVHVLNRHGDGDHRVHRGAEVAWISATELAVGLDGAATSVYAVRSDGTHPRLLVTGYYSPGGLAVSPDGAQLAFTAFGGWGYDRGAALYVASTRGVDTDVRRISPDVCTVQANATTTGGRCLDGTDGADRLVGTKHGDIVLAGAGDDVVHAGDGENAIYGQWGNDTILSGSGPDFVYGGSGDDVIRSGAGGDWIDPGPGRDVVDSGRGADHVVADDGQRDVIDCGPGVDSVRADAVDVTHNCEHVFRP